jgi:hypothetical protein
MQKRSPAACKALQLGQWTRASQLWPQRVQKRTPSSLGCPQLEQGIFDMVGTWYERLVFTGQAILVDHRKDRP